MQGKQHGWSIGYKATDVATTVSYMCFALGVVILCFGTQCFVFYLHFMVAGKRHISHNTVQLLCLVTTVYKESVQIAVAS